MKKVFEWVNKGIDKFSEFVGKQWSNYVTALSLIAGGGLIGVLAGSAWFIIIMYAFFLVVGWLFRKKYLKEQ